MSQVQIVPFYDRTDLIHETLDTLSTALIDEILITIVVVVVLVWWISFMISGLLPPRGARVPGDAGGSASTPT
ncbi:MAG: hypothetical protein R3F43_29645 [bacterium]